MDYNYLKVSEAARLVGTSANHFTKKYIHTGLLSVSKDSRGWRQIEASEFYRMFPNVELLATGSSNIDVATSSTTNDSMLIESLLAQIESLKTDKANLEAEKAQLRAEHKEAMAQLRADLSPPKRLEHKPKGRIARLLEALA